jgi:glyoxylase-like metal-dependent hydrolase (beta-lactamase superfamily II)
MTRQLSVLAAVVVLAVGDGSAQDVRAILQTAATAMGATNLKSVQFSGTGWTAFVGQTFNSASGDWPRFEVPAYTRVIDYDARSSREEFTRRQGNFPPTGGGGTPLQGELRTVALLSGTYAWNMNGDTAVPQTRPYLDGTPVHELRQLEIMLTPHGFLKAAMGAAPRALVTRIEGPSNDGLTGDGRTVTIVSFTALGKYKVNGTINDQNLVEVVSTWIPNPVYGDMLYEVRYTEYRDVGGIKFPMLWHAHQGDPVLNPAHNSQEIRVTNVMPNVAVPAMSVPEPVRTATAATATSTPARVEAQKLADGVWLVPGSHNSLAVEFRDWIAVVEAPLNEERSIAVIEAVQRLVPKKPIRYVVNTHHHFDHSGGLRTYLAQGTTIVTHQANRQFYETVMFYPGSRTLQPDRLSLFYPMYTTSRRPFRLETVDQQYVLSDGVRTMELHPVAGLQHAQGMLVAYLPKEKLLVSADLYSPPAAGAAAPAASATMRALATNIRRLKLDVAQHVPVHGRVGTHEELVKIVGAGGTQ